MNTARKIRGLLCAQGTYCTGQGGSSRSSPLRLDGSQDDQAGEAGWSLLLEAKRLKTTHVRS
jgi:hypothetical protein